VLIIRLLDDDNPVLNLLGKAVAFEVAVGMNGKVWVNSAMNHHTILIANSIEKSENMKLNQVQAMVAKLSSHFEK
jgi:exosome complex component RRP40